MTDHRAPREQAFAAHHCPSSQRTNAAGGCVVRLLWLAVEGLRWWSEHALATILRALTGRALERPHSTRRVAAPDSLKNETFGHDLKIFTNLVAERPAATHTTRLLALPASDAEDRPDGAPEAPERCRHNHS